MKYFAVYERNATASEHYKIITNMIHRYINPILMIIIIHVVLVN